MKIAFFELEGWESEKITPRLPGHELIFSTEKIDVLSIPAQRDFEAISVFVNSRLTKEVLANFPNLKYIATRSTGYDHIDLQACRERNITVAFVPGYGDNTVAEFAFGLLLTLTRRLYASIHQVRATHSFSVKELRGYDLKGKTLGIIGTGRIGREMIKMAKGFGLTILAADPFPSQEAARELGFTYASLEHLLGNSDIISIHCPYTDATHHLLNRSNIELIKKGAYIVNTARGAIIETEALVHALTNGTLRGAAIDVMEEEGETKDELSLLRMHPKEDELRTILENHILMNMPNVLITPHNAFNTQEALERILETTLVNVSSYTQGRPENTIVLK
jgi:D-lactate dehydrogenase